LSIIIEINAIAENCSFRNGVPMASDELRSRWIAEALARTGKTQKGLAQALGLDPASANRLTKGTRRLKASELPLVERYLGERAPGSLDSFADGPPPAPSEYASVPVYDMRIVLQDNQALDDAIPLRYLLLDRRWLAKATDNPRTLVAFEYGDEQMLVDMTHNNPRQEGTYILRLDDVLSKRLVSTHPVNKTLTIRSDDPSQPVYDNLSPDDLDVVGRVIWVGKFLA
jgi:transcriptional regulator with XRE-family HTH domain